MLGGDIYINGTGIISPQYTLEHGVFLNEITSSSENYLKCIEPSYKQYIEPIQIRRMSRIIKMGIVAAKLCIEDANAATLDGIIVGTGLGCVEDTEKFSFAIHENDGGLLSPTAFIQSTHNTISSQIALIHKCHAYNNTFVHRGISFESTLVDAIMILKEGDEATHILVGGVDEITPNSFAILGRIGDWKKEKINSLDLLNHHTKGTIAGEGASFFMLGNKKSDNTYGRIAALRMLYKPSHSTKIIAEVLALVAEANLNIQDIDLVVLGLNGSRNDDEIYFSVAKELFEQKNKVYFKHLCGEYHTASAFACWLSAKIIKTQHIPDVCYLEQKDNKAIRHILVYNHYFNNNHSMFIISQ